MPKTKAQKIKAIESGLAAIRKSQVVIIADFTGLPVNDMNLLRRNLRAIGATFQVTKKRLLKLIFEKEGMSFDPKQFAGQTGAVFSPKDMVETAGVVYQFAKAKKNLFKFLGGVEVQTKKFLEGTKVEKIGQLPGREILLGQLAGALTAPIRQFLFVLKERSKQMVEK